MDLIPVRTGTASGQNCLSSKSICQLIISPVYIYHDNYSNASPHSAGKGGEFTCYARMYIYFTPWYVMTSVDLSKCFASNHYTDTAQHPVYMIAPTDGQINPKLH